MIRSIPEEPPAKDLMKHKQPASKSNVLNNNSKKMQEKIDTNDSYEQDEDEMSEEDNSMIIPIFWKKFGKIFQKFWRKNLYLFLYILTVKKLLI